MDSIVHGVAESEVTEQLSPCQKLLHHFENCVTNVFLIWLFWTLHKFEQCYYKAVRFSSEYTDCYCISYSKTFVFVSKCYKYSYKEYLLIYTCEIFFLGSTPRGRVFERLICVVSNLLGVIIFCKTSSVKRITIFLHCTNTVLLNYWFYQTVE